MKKSVKVKSSEWTEQCINQVTGIWTPDFIVVHAFSSFQNFFLLRPSLNQSVKKQTDKVWLKFVLKSPFMSFFSFFLPGSRWDRLE